MPGPSSSGSGGSVVRQGIEIDLSVVPLEEGLSVREGEYATVRLKLADANTGAPVTAMMPKVWLDLQKKMPGDKKEQVALTCTDKVRTYLQGTLSFRPDIDLNSYYILTLNNDATISVIDPIMGVAGYSQLYAMILLQRPGEDWVFGKDEKTLFVTMPKAGQVAVVDTAGFKVVRNVEAGVNPFRIALQPDGKYLWVGNDAAEGVGGVTILDAASGAVAGRIPTGGGHHEFSFTEDSRFAYVSNSDAGTVTVIDIGQLKKVKDLKTGRHPVSMAYSELSKSVYVAHEGDGAVVAIDGKRHEISGRMQLEPGLKVLRLAPGGRWGFVANALTSTVSVFDASGTTVTYTGQIGKGPDHISFSQEFAYVRSRGTAEVTLIALAALGRGDRLAPFTIPGGSTPATESTFQPSLADSIVPAPEGNAVLIASAADSTIVYYMEGMGVPMGNFSTYGRIPRAVTVINRQLRETAPGTYTAKVRIPASGKYDAVFLLDSPRLVQCFEFSAAANPVLTRLKAQQPAAIEFLVKDRQVRAGEPQTVRFRLTDAATGEPLAGLSDVTVLATLASGSWQESRLARPLPDGVYETDFRAPRPGMYSLYFAVPSLRVKINQLPSLNLQAENPAARPTPEVP